MNTRPLIRTPGPARPGSRVRARVGLLVVCVALGGLATGAARAGVLGPRLRALVHTGLQAAVPAGSRRAVENPLAPRVDASGRVQVVIRPRFPGALPPAEEIAALGGTGIRLSRLLDEIQAWVPVSELPRLAALPGVGAVRVPVYAVVEPPPVLGIRSPVEIPRATTVAAGLPIDQSAVQAMQAALLQAVGAQGQGVKVGVISDDDSGNAASEQAGYLPSNIFQDPNDPGTTPTPGDPAEGTAMLEEVHAMAPQAQLGFCGPQTEQDFLTCYKDFVNWGARVIVDDLGFSPVDMFTRGIHTTGSFASAVATITEAHPGVAFLSAAGNDAQDYFQAPYNPTSTTCMMGTTIYASCMDFGAVLQDGVGSELPVVFLIPGSTFQPVLEWNDPPSTSGTFPDDLALLLVNASGTVLAQSTAVSTTNDGRPFVTFSYSVPSASSTSNPVTGDSLVVACSSCPDAITIKLLGNGDGAVLFGTLNSSNVYTPMSTPGSIDPGQKVAPGVLATVAAAVDGLNPLSATLESYSALGPFLYGNYGSTGTQADPSITGVDDVETSGAGGFSSGSVLPNGGVAFCGTSATGPNVGALVADLMSADPGQSAAFYENALETTASTSVISTNPVAASNPTGFQCSYGNTQGTVDTSAEDDAGVGLAQGYAALASFFRFEVTTVSAPPDVKVSSGGTVTETVPVGVPVTYTATVTAGTNTAATGTCNWPGLKVSGPSATYTFPTAGSSYVVEADCEDAQGILNPSYAVIDVTAANIPPPAVSLATTSAPTVFDLALNGTEPLTLAANSSNTSLLPASGIAFSSGCGTTTLSCTMTLTPVSGVYGSAQVTVTATDPYGQTGQRGATFSLKPPTPTVRVVATSTPTAFDLTLTGAEPLTLVASSSNTALLPASGIAFSSGCGTTTLSCTMTLTPVSGVYGSAQVTVTATDPYGQTGQGTASVSLSAPPPSSGGSGSGGGGGAFGPLVLLLLAALGLVGKRRSRS